MESRHSLKPPEWVRQERNSRSRGLSTEKLNPGTSGEAKASSSCAFAEPCDGKRNRLAPILQSSFIKLRFKFSRSKCRALKDPYVG